MARRPLDGNPKQSTYHGEPGYGYFGKHAGYDYAIVRRNVKAPESGTVTNVKIAPSADGGNIIEMDSGAYSHRFLHMDSIVVKVGQKVNEGGTIGVSGNTGNVGYHLHHDVRKKGTKWTDSFANYIDWEKLIKNQGGKQDMPITKEQENACAVMATGGFPGKDYNYKFVGTTDVNGMLTFWQTQMPKITKEMEKQEADGSTGIPGVIGSGYNSQFVGKPVVSHAIPMSKFWNSQPKAGQSNLTVLKPGKYEVK